VLFNSFSFLASFGAFAALYYAAPHGFRWILLAAASLGFYGTFDVRYVALLVGVATATWVAALAIEGSTEPRRRCALLAGGVAAALGALLVFKYFDFFSRSLEALAATARGAPAFPRLGLVVAAGLSFYTFSCVSYLVDVYRGRLAAERHPGYFLLYVAFFPKLLAGPIERARPFLARVREPVAFNDAGVTLGLQLMLWGLFKKVVIADRLAVFVDGAYAQPSFAPQADLLIATYFFAFQLYCDFSGYSDIAVGAAKVLGFDLMENFRRPYFSRSVPEFWAARWHVSLASWFRDYMYIPMGGNRVSPGRKALNVLAVFLASGLWHGANWTFVVWGGLNGLFAVATPVVSGLWRRVAPDSRLPAAVGSILAALLTFHLVLVTWVFFRAASLADAVTVLGRVSGSLAVLPGLVLTRLSGAEVAVSVALIAVLLLAEAFDEARPMWERLASRPVYVRWAAYYALLLCLLVLGAWDSQQFVYMQF
jgi:alginate O-acetyltransferase complex protein AlgI